MTFASWLCGMARGIDRTERSSRPAVLHSQRSTRRLAVDILEDRTVPSAAVDFAAAQTFPNGGSSPLSVAAGAVAVGDFDGDGHADLATTNVFSNNVGVLLGNGSGGFASPVAFDSGDTFPVSLAVGDFNNDGKADLAVANFSGSDVGVLLGDGSGGFASPVTFYCGGAGAASVAVGDFNNDGNADLAVANNYGANVGVLLGNGLGGFAPAVTFASGGSTPESVAVGDFNNDGHADLAVGHSGSSTVGVLLGDSSGGFAPAVTFASGGSRARFIAVGDFNVDGNADLAVANLGSGNVGVLLGNGSGNFAPAVAFNSGGAAPFSIAVGDFNNDGMADLAVANASSGNVGVLLGNGVGGFAPAASFDAGASLAISVAVGDFNGDGKADLTVMANHNSNHSDNTVSVLLNTTVTNQPPVNTMPGDQVAAEDVAKVINGLSVADDNAAGIVTVTLTAGHGTLNVYSGAASVNGTVLSGNGTASVTLIGTQAQINATLGAASGLTYLGGHNYSGVDTLTMTTTDAGGLSDTDGVAIQVLSAQQQADVLAAIIADLGDDGVLNGGQENALIKKLSFLSGPNGASALQAFINQVNGLVHAGILTQAQGVTLIDGAATIVASMQ